MSAVRVLGMAALAAAVALGCTEEKMEAPPKPAPKPAPEFSLPDLEGNLVSMKSLRGSPVLVNFWASWCLPCVEEMPEIDRFYRAKKDTGLKALMINLKEPPEVAGKMVERNGYIFHTLLDESGEVSEKFQVFGLPMTYFIDAGGVIRYSHMGRLTREIMYAGFDAITEGDS